jgi:hypothetical protein
MMYTVTATVDSVAADAAHTAVVGFTEDYTTCTDLATAWKWAPAQIFDTTDTRTWTLYNFQPGTTYYYKVRVGGMGSGYRQKCGILETTAAPTPTIPTALGYLDIEYDKAGSSNPYSTKYVLMETGDCGGSSTSMAGAKDYLVVLDVLNEAIVWYLDIEAVSGVRNATASGWRHHPGATAASGRILMLIGHQYFFEWAFDGTEIASYDFAPSGECAGDSGSSGPCVHHDVFRSDTTGRTYAIGARMTDLDATGTEWESACGTDSHFVDDTIQTLTRMGTLATARSLMDDYGFDPLVDGGPNAATLAASRMACEAAPYAAEFDAAYGSIDWIHANSLVASRVGTQEVLDLSLKEWNQVIRFNATTGARIWTFSSDASVSDWGTLGISSGISGPAAFEGQHDAHFVGSTSMLLFDNLGDPTASRILRIAMTTAAGTRSATIDRSWALVDAAGDPLVCPVEGSGREVPGTSGASVLANCNDENTMVELNDATGATGTPPPLVIALPPSRTGRFCTSGGPTNSNDITGWHRAFPMTTVGVF